MVPDAYDTVTARLTERTGRTGRNGTWPCPAHDDRNPSLSVSQGDQGVVLHCHAGCDTTDVVVALGLTMADLFDSPKNGGEITAIYDYTDETGALLFQVVRKPGKQFVQRRPDGNGGWIWKLGDTRRVLYRLPHLIAGIEAGATVFVVEGEKDADRLAADGYAATTNPQGAGKWRSSYNATLDGADVVIVADRDEAGRAHARDVAHQLDGVAKSIRVVEAADGKDMSDHLAAGREVEDLVLVDLDAVTGGDNGLDEMSPPYSHSDLGKRRRGDSGDSGDTGTRRTSWTAVELMATSFPEPRWAVPGIVAEGLNLLAGPPKCGKSWLALGLGVSVATGGKALGRIDVDEGPALYLALEDTPRRLKDRLGKILAGDRPPSGLTIAVECPPLPMGGDERIAEWLDRNPDARYVGIDVLARVRGPVVRDASAYDNDYAAISRAKTLADAYGIAVQLVHHTRKMGDEDFVATISGTHGLAGASDAIAVLKRIRGKADGILSITGRDVDEAEYALRFAADIGAWQLTDTPPAEVRMAETHLQILRYVRGHEGVGPTQIAEDTGLNLNLVKQAVRRMARDGDLDSDGKGHYFAPVTAVTAVTIPGQSTFSAVTAMSPPVTDDNPGQEEST
jgi:AAA domain/Winged helix-turn-helix DNA-binding